MQGESTFIVHIIAMAVYRLTIHKTIFTNQCRLCLLQRVRFEAFFGALNDYQLFALLAPHLANQGSGIANTSPRLHPTPLKRCYGTS